MKYLSRKVEAFLLLYSIPFSGKEKENNARMIVESGEFAAIKIRNFGLLLIRYKSNPKILGWKVVDSLFTSLTTSILGKNRGMNFT